MQTGVPQAKIEEIKKFMKDNEVKHMVVYVDVRTNEIHYIEAKHWNLMTKTNEKFVMNLYA